MRSSGIASCFESNERYLPKPSIEPFDGDPLNYYWAFLNRYDILTAGRGGSEDLSLAYLLQHSTEAVYDKVKHHACSLDKRIACEAVWRDLYERFGQLHIVSRCCEKRMTDVPKKGQYDSQGLERLAVSMKRCLSSLKKTSGPTAITSVGFIYFKNCC